MPFFVDVFPSWRFLQIQFAMKQPFCPQRPRRNQSVQSAKAHKVRTSCVHASGQWNWVNFCVNLTTGHGRETTEQLSGPHFHLLHELFYTWLINFLAGGQHLVTICILINSIPAPPWLWNCFNVTYTRPVPYSVTDKECSNNLRRCPLFLLRRTRPTTFSYSAGKHTPDSDAVDIPQH